MMKVLFSIQNNQKVGNHSRAMRMDFPNTALSAKKFRHRPSSSPVDWFTCQITESGVPVEVAYPEEVR